MTTSNPGDLASLLTHAATAVVSQPLLTGMGEPGGAVRYGQGRILAWNASTFENTVAFRGGVLTNLPVLSGPDALTYRQNDIVAVMSWSPNGGAAVHWIMGRVIVPGVGRGEQAIEWMTSELGRRIAAAVFSERIHADLQIFQGTLTTADTWVEVLDFGGSPTSGPVINMEITETGRALLFVGANIQASDGESGDMTFRMDDDVNPPIGNVSAHLRSPFDVLSGLGVMSTGVSLVEGISPGIHEFRAIYRASNLNTGVAFANRVIVGFGF